MQIPAINPLTPTGIQPEVDPASPVNPAAGADQTAGPGEAVVAQVGDYRELVEAHTLDPARVAALLADPFGE